MPTEPERLARLEAMGIDVYRLRRRAGRDAAEDAATAAEAVTAAPEPVAAAPDAVASRPEPVTAAPEAVTAAPEAVAARPAVAEGGSPVATEVTLLDWVALEQTVSRCTQCRLHEGRTQTVFGVGNRAADWMVIGEAPGAEEDRRGEPFVGRAGQLLDQMLSAVGLGRDRVFIANILKCRPPANRDPAAEEASACRGFLDRQIALVGPRVILAVGRIAAHELLGTDAPLGRLRGRVHRLKNSEIPVVVTYHPAYLLRTPREKRKAWQDLCLARRQLDTAST